MVDKKQTTAAEQENTPVPAIVDERTIRDTFYVIRGQQVMLDSDLAAIYGTKQRTSIGKSKTTRQSLLANSSCFSLWSIDLL